MVALRDLRVAVMGTPDFAVAILDALYAAGPTIVATYSQPPRPTGRGHKTQKSPVHVRAETLGVPVFTPLSLRGEAAQEEFRTLDLDVAVVAAYGLILPQPILDAPRLGCINVHASLLPRWRGAAPIQRAILAGDGESGVTIMRMEAGLDTGPMLLTESVTIGPHTTASGLHDTLAAIGAGLIVSALEGLIAGALRAEPQPEIGVSYAAKLSRDEGILDWRETAEINERKIRALNPAPGVSFSHAGERIKVLSAQIERGQAAPGTVMDDDLGIACGVGILRPTLLQRPGRTAVGRRDFLNGSAIPAGTVLPCPATS